MLFAFSYTVVPSGDFISSFATNVYSTFANGFCSYLGVFTVYSFPLLSVFVSSVYPTNFSPVFIISTFPFKGVSAISVLYINLLSSVSSTGTNFVSFNSFPYLARFSSVNSSGNLYFSSK